MQDKRIYAQENGHESFYLLTESVKKETEKSPIWWLCGYSAAITYYILWQQFCKEIC
jgi:hypothetical protein